MFNKLFFYRRMKSVAFALGSSFYFVRIKKSLTQANENLLVRFARGTSFRNTDLPIFPIRHVSARH